MKKIQVTLYCADGRYKPVSTIVEVSEGTDPGVIKRKGIEKICIKRYWTAADLKRYRYTKIKMRSAPEK